jgi:hypothetical protein
MQNADEIAELEKRIAELKKLDVSSPCLAPPPALEGTRASFLRMHRRSAPRL